MFCSGHLGATVLTGSAANPASTSKSIRYRNAGRQEPSGLAQAGRCHGGEQWLWAAKDWDLPLWLY